MRETYGCQQHQWLGNEPCVPCDELHGTDPIAVEVDLRRQVSELRAALARIEGFARSSVGMADSPSDSLQFAWIAEACREALAE